MLQTLLSIRRSPRLPSSAFLSRTVRRHATTLQSQRSTWGDNVPLGKPNFKNVQSKAAETLTGHACRRFATRKRLKFHEPDPKCDLLANHIQREDWTRMVYITRIPKFAIEEDIAGLFKESNFEVDRVVMAHDPMTGFNRGSCFVLLRDPGDVSASATELHDAAVFNRRIKLRGLRDPSEELQDEEYIDLCRGWYASPSSDVYDANMRMSLVVYPPDLFAPVREGRRVAIEDLPVAFVEVSRDLYTLFHDFDVLSFSKFIKYVPKGNNLTGYMLFIDFATRKEAEKALKLKGALIAGRRAIFSLAKPPLKYTASWETTRSTGHYSDRDGGSAVGTNFEEVQEQIYRKWILGHKDRKLWEPTHSYRRVASKES